MSIKYFVVLYNEKTPSIEYIVKALTIRHRTLYILSAVFLYHRLKVTIYHQEEQYLANILVLVAHEVIQ
jgi:hypothetical protein